MNLRREKIALFILIIIAALGLVAFGIDYNKPIDQSDLEYLRALQKLCKQNEDGGYASLIDGERWRNATHYFDVPDCQFRKLIIVDYPGVSENEK